jgi:recombination protein RecT
MTRAVVATTEKKLTFDALLERMKPQITAILPKHLTPERMLALASLAATKTPALKDCTPLSLFNAIVTASRLGLELGTHMHLVPFRNSRANAMECVAIPDYRGLISLAERSGKVRHIDARVVYKGDHFEYVLGSAPSIVHKPSMDTDRSDGNILAFYAVAHLENGLAVFDEPMSKAQVDAVRERSRAKSDGPWVTDYQAMGKKTVVKRLAKFLPQTPEMAAAVELDNRAETGETSTVSDLIDTSDSINATVADRTAERLDELKGRMSGGAAEPAAKATAPAEESGSASGPAPAPAPAPQKAGDPEPPW